jgi:hypothetical protein
MKFVMTIFFLEADFCISEADILLSLCLILLCNILNSQNIAGNIFVNEQCHRKLMFSGDIELNQCYQLKYTLEFIIIKQKFYKHFQMLIKESPPSLLITLLFCFLT